MTGSSKILIIDDDQLSCEILAKRLRNQGFSVESMYDSTEVVTKLPLVAEFDLILLDIMMPKLSGLDVIKIIRGKYSAMDLPIVMVSSLDQDLEVVEAFKLGANDYITKPVNLEVALARIKAQLSVADLNRLKLAEKQLETIQAMVVTYNHEINNPLAIALGSLRELEKSNPGLKGKAVETIRNSLQRIAQIVKSIRDLNQQTKIETEDYTDKIKMFKVK